MASKYDGATIEILNWEKYNPKRLKTMPWVRIDSDIFFSPTFDELEPDERLAFFFLITYSGKRNAAAYEFKTAYFMKHSGVQCDAFTSTIEKLERLQVIAVTSTRRVRGKATASTRQGHAESYTERNVTDVTDETGRNERNGTDGGERPQADRYTAVAPLQELQGVFSEREVDTKAQQAWLDAYPDPPWIVQTIRKALAWEAANPKRRKKDFQRFIGNWLMSDWDKRRGLPGAQQGIDWSKIDLGGSQ